MKRIINLAICVLFVMSMYGCASVSPSVETGGESTPEASLTPEVSTNPTEVTPVVTEKPVATPAPTPNIVETVIYSEDFESGSTAFAARGSETVAVTQALAHDGSYSLECVNRTETWHGPQLDMTAQMTAGNTYKITAWVRYEGTTDSSRIYVKYVLDGSKYENIVSVMAYKGEWTELVGNVTIPDDAVSVAPYFETTYGEAVDGFDLYVDDVVISQVTVELDISIYPALYERYKDVFPIGIAVTANELKDANRVEAILKHFNSITMGNEMKPSAILDMAENRRDPEKYMTEPALDFKNLDVGMKFAQEHGLPMRGHTLLWHEQTGAWFFTEDYSGGALASKEVMLARLDSYIRQVMEYCNENYPGVIYAWDVVNEAINPGDNNPGNYRAKDSKWYEICGPDYVEAAFVAARKYAEPGVKLFYNDFNCYQSGKVLPIYNLCKDLYDKGLLDGLGMQSHIQLGNPSLIDYMAALERYASIGMEIQITELDIAVDTNAEAEQLRLAQRYKRLMAALEHAVTSGTANITGVTVWGLTDDKSWLLKDGPRFPLLFDQYLAPKPAFWGFLQDDSI